MTLSNQRRLRFCYICVILVRSLGGKSVCVPHSKTESSSRSPEFTHSQQMILPPSPKLHQNDPEKLQCARRISRTESFSPKQTEHPTLLPLEKDSTINLVGTEAAPQIRSPCWNLQPDYQQTNDAGVPRASHSSVVSVMWLQIESLH